MQTPKLSEDVMPIAKFKTHASRVLRKLQENRRPVIITQNGRPAAVLITPHDFDHMTHQAAFHDAVLQGLRESAAGQVVTDEELGLELDELLREE